MRRSVIGACEQYLPHIVRLFDSLNAAVSIYLLPHSVTIHSLTIMPACGPALIQASVRLDQPTFSLRRNILAIIARIVPLIRVLMLQKNYNLYEEVVFDISMTLVSKALAHSNLAVELSTSTPPNFPAAGTELRHAAGIMKFLHEVPLVLTPLFLAPIYFP